VALSGLETSEFAESLAAAAHSSLDIEEDIFGDA